MGSKRIWKKGESKVVPKRLKGVTVVSFWMILAVLPWMYRDLAAANFDLNTLLNNSNLMTGLWLVYLTTIVCALGLLAHKAWAWKATIVLFLLHTAWSVYTIYFLMGPSFHNIVLWGSDLYNLPADLIRNIFFILIITYAIWPIIVILFLLHPRVKENFSLAQLEITLADIKPG